MLPPTTTAPRTNPVALAAALAHVATYRDLIAVAAHARRLCPATPTAIAAATALAYDLEVAYEAYLRATA